MADKPKFIDSTKRSQADKVKSDKQMMEAVLSKEREGWTRLSSTGLQYVRPTGYGFVTYVRGEWCWLADRVGQPRKQGKCTLLEAAMAGVQQEIN